jgi:long-chain acyl-CoA synthetase
MAQGRASRRQAEIAARLSRALPEDLLTLVYTSGTTGEPKGVMLTHANMLCSAAAHDRRLPHPSAADVSLCFLPLSHIFERAWTYYALYHGMEINYLEDPKQIIEAIQEIRPTIMCAVPRFYEKIHAAVHHRLVTASPLRQKLFHWAIRTGADRNGRMKDERRIPAHVKGLYRIADLLVLSKIRALVGGRIRFFPCAGAPLAQEIEEFFYAAGIFICYGYGLSETTATVTCHETRHFQFGCVGKPLPGVEVRIDTNEEILVRGPTVMRGYYNKPEATAAVFDDGWLRTGDAGRIAANGELIITDRIKDLMKTSGGKYIAPQMVEALIGSDHFIEQVAVIAEARKYVTALIVPAFEALEAHAQAHNIAYSSREELVRRPEVVAFYRRRIEQRSHALAPFEKIIEFTLLPREFSLEREEVTPTMKIKRRQVNDAYRDVIASMYREDFEKAP